MDTAYERYEQYIELPRTIAASKGHPMMYAKAKMLEKWYK